MPHPQPVGGVLRVRGVCAALYHDERQDRPYDARFFEGARLFRLSRRKSALLLTGHGARDRLKRQAAARREGRARALAQRQRRLFFLSSAGGAHGRGETKRRGVDQRLRRRQRLTAHCRPRLCGGDHLIGRSLRGEVCEKVRARGARRRAVQAGEPSRRRGILRSSRSDGERAR